MELVFLSVFVHCVCALIEMYQKRVATSVIDRDVVLCRDPSTCHLDGESLPKS